MFVLVLYRSPSNMPIIGPFKTSDQAIKHVQAIAAHAQTNGDWRIQALLKPVDPPKKAKAKRARKH